MDLFTYEKKDKVSSSTVNLSEADRGWYRYCVRYVYITLRWIERNFAPKRLVKKRVI